MAKSTDIMYALLKVVLHQVALPVVCQAVTAYFECAGAYSGISQYLVAEGTHFLTAAFLFLFEQLLAHQAKLNPASIAGLFCTGTVLFHLADALAAQAETFFHYLLVLHTVYLPTLQVRALKIL